MVLVDTSVWIRFLPRFASEDAERRFWARHDTTEYFDWSQAVEASFPNLM